MAAIDALNAPLVSHDNVTNTTGGDGAASMRPTGEWQWRHPGVMVPPVGRIRPQSMFLRVASGWGTNLTIRRMCPSTA